MSDETILCRRCGAANTPGDQFCGACGAFLEWEGESPGTEGTATPGTEPSAPPVPPAPGPTPAGPPPTPAVPLAPAAGEIACHACGRPNPPARTFCQSCGTRLRHGAAVPPPPAAAPASGRTAPPAAPAPARGAPAAAPSAGPTARPGAAHVPSAPVRAREPAPARPSGGLPGWLPIVVVLGVLAGVAAVAASTFLRAPDLPSGASSAPGTPPATLTPTLPPASPGDSGAATPAPAGVSLTLTGASASSVVGDREEFQPGKVIDGELTTCWQEGAEEETGAWIEVTLEPSLLDYVVVYSGYQLSHDAFLANLRPKDVTVSVNGGTPQAFVLGDTELPQRIDVAEVSGATTVRITIVSTYDSEASSYPGSPYDDMAISEIRAFGTPGG